VAIRKPFISDKNRKKRLDFAQAHQTLTVEDWSRVLWTDESKYSKQGGDNKRVYVRRRPGEGLEPNCMQGTVKFGGGSILVWGCMAATGVGRLHWVKGILNGPGYVDILANHMQPSVNMLFHTQNHGFDAEENWIFQQDNDPKHTSLVARSWIEKNVPEVLVWPPQSPDLNPIEHLWDEVDRQRDKSSRSISFTLDRAFHEIKRVWYSIPDDFCKNRFPVCQTVSRLLLWQKSVAQSID